MVNNPPRLQLGVMYFTKQLSGLIGPLLAALPASGMLVGTTLKLQPILVVTPLLKRTEKKVVLLIDKKM